MTAQPTTVAHSSTAMGRGVVSLRGVTRSFGTVPHGVEVLHGLDLTIHAGQFTLIMGPSGSGKTTLLTIMGLLLPPTAGAVEILGHNTSRASEAGLAAIRRRHVSFIFQSFNLLSALSAEENVRVVLGLRGIHGREAEHWSHELLDYVGLAARAQHRPAELSGGEKQRVGIARALASTAELLLADEPTGSLDGATARPIVSLLRRVAHEEGRAVVVITHDPRLEPLADRIVRMEDGRIIADTNKEHA